MIGRLPATLRRLGRDRRGAGMLELGLALPVLMVVVLGLIDVATAYSTQMSLQQATARALERVQVGNSRSDFAFVRAEAASAANVPLAQAEVQTWLECDQQRKLPAVTNCATGQSRSRYVGVEVWTNHQPYFRYSPLGPRQQNGSVRLSATSSVRYQ